jgi:transmembrane sensor
MPNPPDSLTVELLDRYFAGEATAAERTWIERETTDPRSAASVRALRAVEIIPDVTPTPALSAEHVRLRWERQRVRLQGGTRLNADPVGYPVQPAIPLRRSSSSEGRNPGKWSLRGLARMSRPWADVRLYGAGIVIAVILCVMLPKVWVSFQPSQRNSTHTYTTHRAERATVSLPNGTRVMLAPETQLTYVMDARGGVSAELQGRAYFVVVPRADRPFVVRTGAVTTRVLGTAFDLQHYAGDPAVKVTVASGKVAVHGATAPTVLIAGMTGHFTDSTTKVTANTDANVAAWTTGQLVFARVPVPQVLETVGRWYGYDFRLQDSTIAKRHLTVSFSTDRPDEVLGILKGILGVSMTFDGKTVMLRRQRVPQTTAPSKQGHDMTLPSPVEVGK